MNLLDRGEEDGEMEGSSTIKESWMMMEGTPPAISDDGDEACEATAAETAGATAAFSSGCCCLPTGASDTADKTKPEPFVEREREKFDHRRFGVLLSAGVNY